MRYTPYRKHQITRMKKDSRSAEGERIIDISIGTAAALLAVTFLKGLFWGYMIRKCRS